MNFSAGPLMLCRRKKKKNIVRLTPLFIVWMYLGGFIRISELKQWVCVAKPEFQVELKKVQAVASTVSSKDTSLNIFTATTLTSQWSPLLWWDFTNRSRWRQHLLLIAIFLLFVLLDLGTFVYSPAPHSPCTKHHNVYQDPFYRTSVIDNDAECWCP